MSNGSHEKDDVLGLIVTKGILVSLHEFHKLILTTWKSCLPKHQPEIKHY